MGNASPFQTSKFQKLFGDIRNYFINEFGPLKLLFEYLRVHQDSNSQNGSSFGNVEVHSLTLSYIPESMRCDCWASFLAHTFASPCFGRKPKVRVVTILDS